MAGHSASQPYVTFVRPSRGSSFFGSPATSGPRWRLELFAPSTVCILFLTFLHKGILILLSFMRHRHPVLSPTRPIGQPHPMLVSAGGSSSSIFEQLAFLWQDLPTSQFLDLWTQGIIAAYVHRSHHCH